MRALTLLSVRAAGPGRAGGFLAALALSLLNPGTSLLAAPAQSWPVAILRDSAKHPIIAAAINDHNDIAGTVQPDPPLGPFTGVHTTGDVVHTITVPGGDSTTSLQPLAINGHGDVVGFYMLTASSLAHAFLLHGSTFTDLTAQMGDLSSFATGINDAGEICGSRPLGGFVLEPNGTVIALGPGIPAAINASGHVVGFSETPLVPGGGPGAFFFADTNHSGSVDAGELVPLAAPPGFHTARNVWLNDADRICGTLLDNTAISHAVLWSSPGTLPTDLPGSPSAGARAFCLNNIGDVVGSTQIGNVVWIKGGVPTPFQPHLGTGASNRALAHIDRINNAGRALGVALVGGVSGVFDSVVITVRGAGGGGSPADLSAAWGSLTWKKSGPRNNPKLSLTGTLTVTNAGTTPSAKSTSAVFFASADGVLDTDDLQLRTAARKPVVLKIGAVPDKKHRNPVAFKFAYTLPHGVQPSSLAGMQLIASIHAGHADGSDSLAVGSPIPTAP